jgi:hypothetical protein
LVQEEKKTPESKCVKGKPKYSTGSANQNCHQSSKMTLSPQEDGPNQQGLNKKNVSGSIEREDWSLSYPKLDSFISFSYICY